MIDETKQTTCEQEGQKKRFLQKHKGCLWTLLIIIVINIAFTALFVSVLKQLMSETVELQDNTVYHIQMKGTVVEQAPEDNPFDELLQDMPLAGEVEQKVGLDVLIRNIRLAKTDDRIRGIYLDGGDLNIGLASAKYLRDALIDFKSSGKFIIAYADHYNALNYYIATAANYLYLDEVGQIDWHGFAAIKLYYPRLLSKLSIRMNVIKVGTFKSAVEPYINTHMSKEDEQQTLQFLNGAWQTICHEIGTTRGISTTDLNDYADECLEMQPQHKCVDYHMVDSLIHRYDMYNMLALLTGTSDYHLMNTQTLMCVETEASDEETKIAVLYADGEITDNEGDGIVATKMLKTIHQIGENDKVKAVVLRVNSPGGSATASEQIWYAVTALQKAGLPVVVSMGDYAASGGYYISCAADYIYAEPTTLTGSIGIFGLVPDVSGLRERVGIDIDGIGTNTYADSHMILKGMSIDEKDMMQGLVDRGYELFVCRCADGRHMSPAAVKQIAEGRVWLGKDALNIGLVDELGNIDDAINKAAELAGINHYTMAYYPERKSFWDELIESMDGSSDEERILSKMKKQFSQQRVMARMPELIVK